MTGRSAWLDIPLDDYEGHMALPSTGQAEMLADQLARLIARSAPRSIAVAGCAGGNGFERIGPPVGRIVAIDINPDYLDALRARHGQRLQGLELLCADIESIGLEFPPVDLIYAALILEYVDLGAALATFRRNAKPGATLAALIQLAAAGHEAVSPSPYESLGKLKGSMRLVAPAELREAAAAAGFARRDSRTLGLPSGKRFQLEVFAAPS
ncbi:MAG TPA: class I SAM-dependent methyltransferase [Steroidobacteraceae bacterium]|nr:class I SAM-dependent methyltransferase [Steroidobacteraceae bacterium]